MSETTSMLETELSTKYAHIKNGPIIGSKHDIDYYPELFINKDDLVIIAKILTGQIAKSSTKAALNRIINNQKFENKHTKKLWTALTNHPLPRR